MTEHAAHRVIYRKFCESGRRGRTLPRYTREQSRAKWCTSIAYIEGLTAFSSHIAALLSCIPGFIESHPPGYTLSKTGHVPGPKSFPHFALTRLMRGASACLLHCGTPISFTEALTMSRQYYPNANTEYFRRPNRSVAINIPLSARDAPRPYTMGSRTTHASPTRESDSERNHPRRRIAVAVCGNLLITSARFLWPCGRVANLESSVRAAERERSSAAEILATGRAA